MEDMKTLRKNYPQKYYMKLLCNYLYYFGCGTYWYEKSSVRQPLSKKILYGIWVVISNTFLTVVLFNEHLAHARNDLIKKEKTDLLQHSLGHSCIWLKILVLYIKKTHIKKVLKRFLEGTRYIYSDEAIDKAALTKSIRYCCAMALVVYATLLMAEVDGIRTHFVEGIPVRTEVTYYPGRVRTGLIVNIIRFLMEFHWWYLITVMLIVDYLSVSSLVFIEAKFKLLQLYFQDLLNTITDESKDEMERNVEFKTRFIEGIKLHEDALWSAKSIQASLGATYSIQILECLSMLVICFIKLVTGERNFVLLLANLSFIICIIILTGTYMTAAGDITYEASNVSTAIFHCGWELYHKKTELRTLAVLAIQRSHVPVYMTAFGIMELSYANFIAVLRSSYSFFAVMY